MTDRQLSLAGTGAIALVSFIIVSSLIQPGTLDLLTPTHSDFYRYFLLSEVRWLPANWLAPRPLMLAYLKIAGIFHEPRALFFLLCVPALLFVASIPYVATKAGYAKSEILSLAVFFLAAFGSPYFYSTFQFDYGGMLSGLFAMGAIYFGFAALGREDRHYYATLPAILFCLLSVESKPTYSLALLYLGLVAAVLVKGRQSKLLLAGALLVLCWSFIKEKLLGSPFVASSDAPSPYAVVVNPLRNLQTLWFYMVQTFTVPLAVTASLSTLVLLARGEWKLAVVMVLLTASASAPMALLVNRQWASYAWYSTVVIALLAMMATGRLTTTIRSDQRPALKALAALVLLAIVASVTAHAFTRHASVEWTLANQQYNRNVLEALDGVSADDGLGKILIAGIQGPYHPFKNTAFVTLRYPRLGHFDFLLRKGEKEWNQMSHELTNGIYLDNLTPAQYSRIIVFDGLGKIASTLPATELEQLSEQQRSALLVCGTTRLEDPAEIARIIGCLNDAGEYERAQSLGSTYIALGERQPWLYYYLSKSYLATGKAQRAGELLKSALAVEPENPQFKLALSAVEPEIRKGENSADQ
jgi:tetratricopeptide (TPR) repeat protein